MQPSVHGLASFGGCIIVGLETGEAFDYGRQILSTCLHQGNPFQWLVFFACITWVFVASPKVVPVWLVVS
jgi:hypothetical protein